MCCNGYKKAVMLQNPQCGISGIVDVILGWPSRALIVVSAEGAAIANGKDIASGHLWPSVTVGD